jgi:hypothetical protein
MKTHLIRLGSVVPHGVGGPEAGCIDLIYSFLLQEYHQNIYSHIGINQIGDDLDEFVMKMPGNCIHINIRYPVHENFESKSVTEKNRIRLDVVHESLLRIAKEDNKLDIDKLEIIRDKILKQDFSFDLVYKVFLNKKNESLLAKIIITPLEDRFKYFVIVEENEIVKCKHLIYIGMPSDYYIDGLFSTGKWKGVNEFIVSGKKKEMEIHINVDKCSVEYLNVSGYNGKAPFFELMKKQSSKDENDKAYKNWIHSLPPAIAAIVAQEAN